MEKRTLVLRKDDDTGKAYRFKILLPNGTSVELTLRDPAHTDFHNYKPHKCHILQLHDGRSEMSKSFENMWDFTPDFDLLLALPEEYSFQTALADLIDNSLQALWSKRGNSRKLIRVNVGKDKISIFDNGPGMDDTDDNSLVKWGKMGASLHRNSKLQAIGGKPPYLMPYFGMFAYGGPITSMHLGRRASVSSKTKHVKKVYMLHLEREALLSTCSEVKWKTDIAHHSPLTTALTNLGNKISDNQKDVAIEIRKDPQVLTPLQLEREYAEWLLQMHGQYDEEADSGEDQAVIIVSPGNKKELRISSDVIRVHKVLKRNEKSWKHGEKIKVLKGACAGCHETTVFATIESFLLEGFEGDAVGGTKKGMDHIIHSVRLVKVLNIRTPMRSSSHDEKYVKEMEASSSDKGKYVAVDYYTKGGRAPRRAPCKRALLIGVILVRDEVPLVHVLPEIEAMKQILINSHQFEDKNITLLCDHGNYQHPTRKKIKQEVKKLIKYAVPGDVCFLHLAGEGYWSRMMKKLSLGARLTILLNACHAGCFFKDAEKDEGIGEKY